jgi:hypothetical protein
MSAAAVTSPCPSAASFITNFTPRARRFIALQARSMTRVDECGECKREVLGVLRRQEHKEHAEFGMPERHAVVLVDVRDETKGVLHSIAALEGDPAHVMHIQTSLSGRPMIIMPTATACRRARAITCAARVPWRRR